MGAVVLSCTEMPVRVSPIDVVEEAYRPYVDDHAWLKGIATTVRPLVDGGLGVFAFLYDLAVPPIGWRHDAVVIDCDPKVLEKGLRSIDLASGNGPTYGCRAQGSWHARVRWDSREAIIVGAAGPPGRGLAVVGLQPHPRPVDRRARRLWTAVAMHVTAAHRIRSALDGQNVTEQQRTGSTASRRGIGDALRAVVLRHERARISSEQAESDRVAATWRMLLDGRSSLVDHFACDGRRYLVARVNQHDAPDPRALTDRERAVVDRVALGRSNRRVARELGLARSTVASHLANALRKLGLGSRTELAGVVSAVVATAREEPKRDARACEPPNGSPSPTRLEETLGEARPDATAATPSDDPSQGRVGDGAKGIKLGRSVHSLA